MCVEWLEASVNVRVCGELYNRGELCNFGELYNPNPKLRK